MIIDLHGLNEQQAVMRILNALFAFNEQSHEDEITFITGRGNVLRFVLEKTLAEEGFFATQDAGNPGSYTLRKRRRRN